MLLGILSILLQIVFFVILHLELYTDRVVLPGGEVQIWRRSPIDRLGLLDRTPLLYLYLLLAAVSIITGILYLTGDSFADFHF